jgi:hypothetical protein
MAYYFASEALKPKVTAASGAQGERLEDCAAPTAANAATQLSRRIPPTEQKYGALKPKRKSSRTAPAPMLKFGQTQRR